MIRMLLLLVAAMLVVTTIWSVPANRPAMQSSGEAKVGGPFTLTDTQGKRVSNSDFAGKLMLVYLGYTHCPDICPATLASLSDVLKKLGPDSEKVNVLFISLDPAHDTPQVLGEYLKSFDPRIVGLTGSEAEIKNVTSEYKGYASPLGTGSMLITHSGLLYLMGRDGKYLKHFDTGAKEEDVIAAVKENF